MIPTMCPVFSNSSEQFSKNMTPTFAFLPQFFLPSPKVKTGRALISAAHS